MEAESDLWESHKDIVKQASVLKKEGNTSYVAKDYRKAIGKYHRAIIMLRAVGSKPVGEIFGAKCSSDVPHELKADRDQLKCECYNNLAACLLARDDPKYERVVEHCEEVLELDRGNKKAIFRMGTALFHLGKLDNAVRILTSNPACQSDKQIQVLLRSIREKEKLAEEKSKETYRRMFSSGLNKQQTESNRRGHSDPIVIKNSVSSGDQEIPISDCTASSNQGTKFIQVASVNNEAPC